MKINLVPFIISFIACSLIAYTFYIFSPKDEFIYSITSFIISVCTIGFGIGFKSDSERITMLNRTVASVFFCYMYLYFRDSTQSIIRSTIADYYYWLRAFDLFSYHIFIIQKRSIIF